MVLRVKDKKLRWVYGNVRKFVEDKNMSDDEKVKKIVRIYGWYLRELGIKVEFEEVKE